MKSAFKSRLGEGLEQFLAFKRALGYSYRRAEWALRSFDRHVHRYGPRRGPLPLESLLRGWLGRIGERSAVSVAAELAPVRQFLLFRRRSDPGGFVPSRDWVVGHRESRFVPHILSRHDVLKLLSNVGTFCKPRTRAPAIRALILMLYCTGLRLGEAVRLTIADVDLKRRVLLIRESKGKTRLVPFRADLGRELERYVRGCRSGAAPQDGFLVRPDGRAYTTPAVSELLCRLLRRVGLKPPAGRQGPRPFDFRPTFAVHRLTRWYRSGANLHARLPWLSAYMGHDDLLGTEVYLRATPELLAIAARRMEQRLDRVK